MLEWSGSVSNMTQTNLTREKATCNSLYIKTCSDRKLPNFVSNVWPWLVNCHGEDKCTKTIICINFSAVNTGLNVQVVCHSLLHFCFYKSAHVFRIVGLPSSTGFSGYAPTRFTIWPNERICHCFHIPTFWVNC